MSMYRKLTTVAAVAALAFGLAACGGGGGDDTADAPTTTEPTGSTPAEQISELQSQINELRAGLGLPPIDIEDLTGSVAELTQQVANLQKQIDDAADAEAEEDAKANSATAKALKAAIAYQPRSVLMDPPQFRTQEAGAITPTTHPRARCRRRGRNRRSDRSRHRC